MLVQLMGGQLSVDTAPGAGSTFRIRLQLPRVHGQARAQAARTFAPEGYEGRRRRILVADNEKNDRELLVNILAPLGFETMQAESGADCVDRYASFQPDLVLMDLAMPVMDGWEASRILRREHGAQVPILIVSANAYEKGQQLGPGGPENPAGIAPDDFIVKPVNVAELLERIGVRLELAWTMRPAGPAPQPERPALAFPPTAHLEALRTQVRLGYVRGVNRELDAIAALDPQYAAFADALRQLAARFDLDAMAAFIERGQTHGRQTI
jgi:CheY-like chemotaxis protein